MGDPGGLLPLALGGQKGCDPAATACSPSGRAAASVVLTSGGRSGDCRGRSGRCHLFALKARSGFSLSRLKARPVHVIQLRGADLAFPDSKGALLPGASFPSGEICT